MPKYLVHTVSIFRTTYLVEAENAEYAKDLVVCNTEVPEVDQEWIGENIVTAQELTGQQLKNFLKERFITKEQETEITIKVPDLATKALTKRKK